MRFKIKIRGEEIPIEIIEKDEGLEIKIGEKKFFYKNKEKEKIEKITFPQKEKKKEIKAPISGKVERILIKTNEKIKVGQPVLVLSSMKMENEIVSESEGVVKKICVKEKEEVDAGQILIILK